MSMEITWGQDSTGKEFLAIREFGSSLGGSTAVPYYLRETKYYAKDFEDGAIPEYLFVELQGGGGGGSGGLDGTKGASGGSGGYVALVIKKYSIYCPEAGLEATNRYASYKIACLQNTS